MKPNDVPLCIDLDGTLVRTDTLYESALAAVKADWLFALRLPLLLAKGKAALKDAIARRTALDPALLPYNAELLTHLQIEAASGRSIYLVTAANERIAQRVAAHVGLFRGTYASDEKTNLKGPTKAEFLKREFGERGYDYAGNGFEDLPVWRAARRALVVNAPKGVFSKLGPGVDVALALPKKRGGVKLLARALRVHQWSKNLLVFVPLALAKVSEGPAFLLALGAFVAMSLAASSVYLVNDVADLESDRAHAYKASRPFASGALDIRIAFVLAPLLLVLSAIIAAWVSPATLCMVLGYVALTTAYTFWLKRQAIADTLTLACLYTWRVLIGGIAAGVVVSEWALAFSCFFFLSLAFVKRVSEVLPKAKKAQDQETIKGRGYVATDLITLQVMGGASGYLAVLVFALYLNGENVRQLYAQPRLLWLLCPLLFYWISRVWLLTNRNRMHADPVIFALKDPLSYGIGLLGLVVWALASFL